MRSAAAAWALYTTGALRLSALLSVAVVVHYVASYDHVRWVIARFRLCAAASLSAQLDTDCGMSA